MNTELSDSRPDDDVMTTEASIAEGADSMQGLVRRRWYYTITDWNDDESHVDENGDEVCRDDAKEHIGTDAEAAIESKRRADLWETKQDTLVARVTCHSQGIVRESPNE